MASKKTAGVFVAAAWLGLAALHAEEPKLRDTLKGHTDPVRAGAFSPDGKTLATRAMDSTTRIWDLAGGKAVTADEKGMPGPLAFSADGKTLLLSWATVGSPSVCDVATGKCTATKTGPIETLAFSPDGKLQVLWDGKKRAVLLRMLATPFDLSTGKDGVALDGARSDRDSVVFSPDGKTLTTKDKDNNVVLWDATGTNIATLPKTAGRWVVFSPDGKTLAAESGHKDNFLQLKDRCVTLWDAAAGKSIGTLQQGPSDLIEAVVFSPDGKTIAGGAVRTVKTWDATSGKSTGVMQKTTEVMNPHTLAFSPDGKFLAAACTDSTVNLWSTANGKMIASLKGSGFAAFSPDGTTLATGSEDGSVKLWNMPAAKPKDK